MNFFVQRSELRRKTQIAFQKHHRRLVRLVPQADIQHIGSTAIPGAITKGDLDLLVRVSRADFVRADKLLAASYARNTSSHRSRSFSSFKDDEADPPLGIQLTVQDSALDNFLKFRDSLMADAALVKRYNQLKRRCAGLSMAAYRRRKSAFIERVLAAIAN